MDISLFDEWHRWVPVLKDHLSRKGNSRVPPHERFGRSADRCCPAHRCRRESLLKEVTYCEDQLLLNAVDVVAHHTVDFGFDEAMYITLEAGQLLVELAHKLQVINNYFIEALTWDQ